MRNATELDGAIAPRAPLKRDRILREAVALADAEGIAAVSMRRLARVLGVEAMSLYNHVAHKDDLLAGMLDLVVNEFEAPHTATDWTAAIRRGAISAHDALMRHRWAASLMNATGIAAGPARLRWMDGVLRCLRDAGFSVEVTHLAYHAIDSNIIGFTLWQLSYTFEKGELADIGRAFLDELPIDEFPFLAEHVRHHLEPTADDVNAFEFGLGLLLDGLERERILWAAPSLATLC